MTMRAKDTPSLQQARVEQVTLHKLHWHSNLRPFRWIPGGIPKNLQEAKELLARIPESDLPGMQVLSGVSHSEIYALTTPEEAVYLSNRGYRQHLVSIPKKDGEARKENQISTLWVGDELLASTFCGRIDLEATKKLDGRNLVVVQGSPAMASIHGFNLQVVGFWLNEDPEDFTYPREIDTWDVVQIGGKGYFLYPEKRVAPIGCCRAISMKILKNQFDRFNYFRETLAAKAQLWEKIRQAFAQENLALA